MAVYITADLHGNINEMNYREKYLQQLTKNDIVIIAGDAGLEYDTFNSTKLKRALFNLPCSWIIMRGNHDDCYFNNHCRSNSWIIDDTLYGNKVIMQKKYPNIYYIKDEGGLYNIQGKKIFFIPGAYSIDKDYRYMRGLPYNVKEQLTHIEMTQLYKQFKDIPHIDYVISHTIPYQFESKIKYLFLPNINQNKVDKNTEKWLDKFYNLQKFKHWYCGHFHDDINCGEKLTMVYHKILKLED